MQALQSNLEKCAWCIGKSALVTSGKNLEGVYVLHKLLNSKSDATDCVASKENNQQEPIEEHHRCPIPQTEGPASTELLIQAISEA